MTDKLHCPFCGAELDCVRPLGGRAEYWMCQNTKSCPAEDFVGNKEIWQALIDGKAAQDALDKCQSFIGDLVRYHLEPGTPENKKGNELLKGIASITTQELNK